MIVSSYVTFWWTKKPLMIPIHDATLVTLWVMPDALVNPL